MSKDKKGESGFRRLIRNAKEEAYHARRMLRREMPNPGIDAKHEAAVAHSDYRDILWDYREGFRRTLVGLKLSILVLAVALTAIQTYPCGVEATRPRSRRPPASRFRRTLVGLKPAISCSSTPRRPRFRRTLVGLKLLEGLPESVGT